MMTMKKAPRLDADLWCQLQEHIPLQTIYEKLSQQDLFRLRFVSKEWNQAALQWLLPEPSFVTIVASADVWDVQYLNGIVAINSASGKFMFYRQRLRLCHVRTHVAPFEVEGLILCHNLDNFKERGVFNVHNQTWHAIPAGLARSETLSACGLVVDTTVRPYTFKLVEGNLSFWTQIYDSKSRSWSRTSSRLPSSFMEFQLASLEYSCMCHNDNVYISLGRHKIWKYSLEDDKWTELKPPKVSNLTSHISSDNVLGVWAGRIFTTREDRMKRRVSVWELVDFERQEWVEYARMPQEQYKRLLQHEMDGFFHNDEEVALRSFFREGYLLVFIWRWEDACANVLLLFDIATKIWRKVDLPWGTVAMDKLEQLELESGLESEDFEEDEDHYSDEDFDEDDNVDEDDDVDGYVHRGGNPREYVYIQEQFD